MIAYGYPFAFGEDVIIPFFLKALTNEKRGGLTVVPFDRSRFKLCLPKNFKHIGAGPIL
jgi:hypothetical protein